MEFTTGVGLTAKWNNFLKQVINPLKLSAVVIVPESDHCLLWVGVGEYCILSLR